jgi:CheY-like chemotaxis protein
MPNELEGKRIFIIEDDVMNMAVNSVSLRRSGATVFQDPLNINTLERIVVHLPIDIILLDLMLRNKVNGYDIYDAIRVHPELKDIPVVAVSAADPNIEIPKAQEKGLDGFIGKPIRPTLFAQQIASCINGNPVWYSQDGKEI